MPLRYPYPLNKLKTLFIMKNLTIIKLIFSLFIFQTLFSCSMNAQQIKVVYKEELKASDVSKQVDDPAIEALVKKQLKSMDKTMCLSVDDKESIYKECNQGRRDGSVYKNFTKKESITQESIVDRSFIIKESLTNKNWKLLQEETVICGLKCKKAQNADGDIAWYCPSLAINDGPSKYYGLPGLILKIETKVKIITAENIITDKSDIAAIEIPKGGKEISRDEFNNLRKKKLEELGVSEGSSGSSNIKIIRM
jgi:GLPGLI family protein